MLCSQNTNPDFDHRVTLDLTFVNFLKCSIVKMIVSKFGDNWSMHVDVRAFQTCSGQKWYLTRIDPLMTFDQKSVNTL